jgi:glycosyltransferase involved in cell wall biosynthesis
MRIALVHPGSFPAERYGGTERVVWDLGAALAARGHEVTLVAGRVSRCPFGTPIEGRGGSSLIDAVPGRCDVVHVHDQGLLAQRPADDRPTVVTIHGNLNSPPVHPNSVFVSQDHARRHGAHASVLNGLDWSRYPAPDLASPRSGYHFLGKAAWSVKNVRGAIWLARRSGRRIAVLGGHRLNFSMGFRFTPWPGAAFHGMVDDAGKAKVLSRSEGLVFPVLWHEPFGLAVIESLYMGCGVFATAYGALPELVTPGTHGFLSNSRTELLEAMRSPRAHADPAECHRHASSAFSSDRMAADYLAAYERVLSGENLNPGPMRAADRWRDLAWAP